MQYTATTFFYSSLIYRYAYTLNSDADVYLISKDTDQALSALHTSTQVIEEADDFYNTELIWTLEISDSTLWEWSTHAYFLLQKAFEKSATHPLHLYLSKTTTFSIMRLTLNIPPLAALTTLTLQHSNLESIPYILLQDTLIETLDLSSNNIHIQCPYHLTPPKALKRLSLTRNLFSHFIPEPWMMHLEYLDLEDNLIQTFQSPTPHQHLISLNLNNNELQDLPKDLKNLHELHSLGLSYNPLSALSYTQELPHSLRSIICKKSDLKAPPPLLYPTPSPNGTRP